MNLVEVFRERETDKVPNGIAEIYDQLFGPIRYEVESLLEIGVDRGGSIKGWLEYFPNAEVFGIDLREFMVMDERYTHYTVNVTDEEALLHVLAYDGYPAFDIVIDDGSHWNNDIIKAFKTLWPFVTPGGYYCIEDIQVPWRSHAYPRTEVYFTNWAKEHGLEFDIPRYNLMWVRKEQNSALGEN